MSAMPTSGQNRPPQQAQFTRPQPQYPNYSSSVPPKTYFSGNSHTQGQATLKFFLIIVVYAAFHWFIDYRFFEFTNSPARILVHMLFAILYASMYLNDEARPKTIILLTIVAISNYLFSLAAYSTFLSLSVRYGGPELLGGIILIIMLSIKPEIFSKTPYNRTVLIYFILSAYFIPAITGLVNTFSSISFVSMFSLYLTPFFFPVWYYNIFTGEPASHAAPWSRYFFLIVWILLLLPIVIGPITSSFDTTGGNGVTLEQKDAFIGYLTKVGDNSLTMGREFTNSTITSIQCSYYSFTNQLGSITGQNGADSKYAKCLKPSDGAEYDAFASSVERGSLSSSSMTLSTVSGAQNKYYQHQDATFLTTFKAQSIDTPLTVRTACTYASVSLPDAKSNGDMNNNKFTVEGSISQDLVCTIPAGRLAPSTSYEYTTAVTFDYVTSAYITRYFTSEENLATFRSGSASATDNLLSFYAVPEKQPISKSTKGPVKIGMNAESGLIVLNSQYAQPKEFTVVVTLENQNSWKGKMQNVNSILLSVPKGLELKERTLPVTQLKAPSEELAKDEPSWSNYECATGAFTGNFRQVTADECDAPKGTLIENYTDVDCTHYNNYVLKPGYGTGKTAIEVKTGLEVTQKPFISCQVVANNAQALFSKNSNFATKSLQSRASYTYQLQQTKSFRVEAKAPGDSTLFADKILSSHSICTMQNAYSLDPNILLTFFQNEKRLTDNANSKKFNEIYASVRAELEKNSGESSALFTSDCIDKSIALAIIVNDWSQVQGNPMTINYRYGYLSANKAMITYLQSKGVTSIPAATDATYTDATQLDAYLRENNIKVAMAYLKQLATDCKSSSSSVTDYSCVVGKYKCGVNYTPRNYLQCAVSNCQYCEEHTATDIVTWASQIGQIKDLLTSSSGGVN